LNFLNRGAGLQPGILTPLLWRAFKDPQAP